MTFILRLWLTLLQNKTIAHEYNTVVVSQCYHKNKDSFVGRRLKNNKKEHTATETQARSSDSKIVAVVVCSATDRSVCATTDHIVSV